MFYLILTMFIGMAAGFLMRRVKALAHIGKAISITISLVSGKKPQKFFENIEV